MNGYLLLLVHEMDDCPIGLYFTREGCLYAAKNRDISQGLYLEEAEILETDASTPVGLMMIEFVGGVPVKREVLKWVDE